MPTQYYHNLARRVQQITDRLLPPLSPIGSYTSEQYDQVRGYLLLCHAEVESYLEDMAVEALEQSLGNWKTKKRVNRCLAALMLHHDPSTTPKPRTMGSHIHLAVEMHKTAIRKNNHGVKEHNLFTMYAPIGLEKSEVSSVLTAELDSLGVARGKIAHTSGRAVKTPPDPGTISSQVNLTIRELLDFDSVAVTLRKR